jgi:hypothetical protein
VPNSWIPVHHQNVIIKTKYDQKARKKYVRWHLGAASANAVLSKESIDQCNSLAFTEVRLSERRGDPINPTVRPQPPF